MIIVLEGLNGAGKSTIARALSQHLGIPIVRPFKGGNSDFHWDGVGVSDWDRLKVPVNTHVDDFYVADMLYTLGASAILDRSMSSAVAYGLVMDQDGGWYRQKGLAQELLTRWAEMLSSCTLPILYVHLDVSYHAMKKRCDGRWHPNKAMYHRLVKWFNKAFQGIKFSKKRINTDISDNERCVDAILARLEWLTEEKHPRPLYSGQAPCKKCGKKFSSSDMIRGYCLDCWRTTSGR